MYSNKTGARGACSRTRSVCDAPASETCKNSDSILLMNAVSVSDEEHSTAGRSVTTSTELRTSPVGIPSVEIDNAPSPLAAIVPETPFPPNTPGESINELTLTSVNDLHSLLSELVLQAPRRSACSELRTDILTLAFVAKIGVFSAATLAVMARNISDREQSMTEQGLIDDSPLSPEEEHELSVHEKRLSDLFRPHPADDVKDPMPERQLPDLPPNLLALIRRKRALRRLWQQTRCPRMRRDFRALAKRVKVELESHRLRHMYEPSTTRPLTGRASTASGGPVGTAPRGRRRVTALQPDGPCRAPHDPPAVAVLFNPTDM